MTRLGVFRRRPSSQYQSEHAGARLEQRRHVEKWHDRDVVTQCTSQADADECNQRGGRADGPEDPATSGVKAITHQRGVETTR